MFQAVKGNTIIKKLLNCVKVDYMHLMNWIRRGEKSKYMKNHPFPKEKETSVQSAATKFYPSPSVAAIIFVIKISSFTTVLTSWGVGITTSDILQLLKWFRFNCHNCESATLGRGPWARRKNSIQSPWVLPKVVISMQNFAAGQDSSTGEQFQE